MRSGSITSAVRRIGCRLRGSLRLRPLWRARKLRAGVRIRWWRCCGDAAPHRRTRGLAHRVRARSVFASLSPILGFARSHGPPMGCRVAATQARCRRALDGRGALVCRFFWAGLGGVVGRACTVRGGRVGRVQGRGEAYSQGDRRYCGRHCSRGLRGHALISTIRSFHSHEELIRATRGRASHGICGDGVRVRRRRRCGVVGRPHAGGVGAGRRWRRRRRRPARAHGEAADEPRDSATRRRARSAAIMKQAHDQNQNVTDRQQRFANFKAGMDKVRGVLNPGAAGEVRCEDRRVAQEPSDASGPALSEPSSLRRTPRFRGGRRAVQRVRPRRR